MPRGRPKQNKGPCVVCGSQNDKMIYRPLHDWSLEKTYNSPSFSLLSITLKIGDELCEKDYNELVVYDRNTKLSSKRHTDADTSYVPSGSQKKRICLSEGEYEKLLSAASSIDQLKEEILSLEEKMEEYEDEIRQIQTDGIYFLKA